jgi:hypothetical protein
MVPEVPGRASGRGFSSEEPSRTGVLVGRAILPSPREEMVVENRPDDGNPRFVDIYFTNTEEVSEEIVLKNNPWPVTHHVSYTALSII